MDISEVSAMIMAQKSTEITAQDVRAAIDDDPDLKSRYEGVVKFLAEFRIESLETEARTVGYE